MMRWLFFLLAAGPAMAQSAPPMTAADCRQSYDILVAEAQVEMTAKSLPKLTGDGWCLIEGLDIPFDINAFMRVTEMRWRMADYDRIAQSLPPTAISLRADGVSYIPEIGDPVMDYLFEIQSGQGSVAASLDAHWDQADRTVSVTQARVHFAGDNSVFVSAFLRDVDISDPVKLQLSVGQMALTELNIEIESNGLFENYVAMAVGAAVLEGSDDPAADVARYKAAGRDIVQSVPSRILDGTSKDALRRLIRDMPHPSGMLRLQVQSETGLAPLTLAPAALAWSDEVLDEVWSFLPELTIEARYSPSNP